MRLSSTGQFREIEVAINFVQSHCLSVECEVYVLIDVPGIVCWERGSGVYHDWRELHSRPNIFQFCAILPRSASEGRIFALN